MPGQLYLSEFFLPFGGKLCADNQWVQLAEMMPWEEIEKNYSKNFRGSSGQKAISARIAFGAVYIQLKCGYTDIKVVDEIRENPYLQYFLGYTGFSDEPPKDYLIISKQRDKPGKNLRKAIGKQLRYIERDLKIIDRLIIGKHADMMQLKKDLHRKYCTIRGVFQQ